MKIYMCPPVYFSITDYAMNYYTRQYNDSKVKIIARKYQNQYYNLILTLLNLGIQIEFIKAIPELSDMTYMADSALILSNIIILGNFRVESRRKETPYHYDYLSNKGYVVYKIPSYFEGGDAILSNNIIWLGYGFRTEKKSARYIEKIITNYQVKPLHLVDERFYHLDTCFCPLPNGYLLYYKSAFSKKSLKLINHIYNDYKRRIGLTYREAKLFICNALIYQGEKTIYFICHKISTRIKEILNSLNIQVIEVNVSQFLLAGGSVRCLSLIANTSKSQ